MDTAGDFSSHPAQRRREARSLSPEHRMDQLVRLAQGDRRNGYRYPELLGLLQFQRWLTLSNRLDLHDGSPWWREVNGHIVLDMVDTAAGLPPSSEPQELWQEFWSSDGRSDRTRSWWAAHQASLTAGQQGAVDLLAEEDEHERAFVQVAVEAVALAARAELPTRGMGSRVVGGFCAAFYPDSYPAGAGDGVDGRHVLHAASGHRHPGVRTGLAVVRRHFRRTPLLAEL